ncbi:hypothetical protein CAEBREN_05721 [Caenorhabditis brenneri]|uniref:T20D4.11-like domain-containing protein n=1 Tax=Caenorhabditis brenneri TaxID=135651 RepID=G0NEX0_CAEBE|nr:hypothetical protein CAEBREN_05721 [Caenorhabditis brenneri]
MLIFTLTLLLTSPSIVFTVPESCFLPEMRTKAKNCVDQLIPMQNNLRFALDGTWKSHNITRDIIQFCDKALDCYNTLQVCAGIDKTLISNMDGVCALYSFKSGKFNDCYEKIGSNSYDNCVYSFFMSPVYIDAPNNRQRCQSLKSNGKCVKSKAQSSCSKDYANDFEDHLDGQLKRFSCKN